MTIIIGIDPGVSGALAALEFGRKGVSRVLDVIDMPTAPGIKKRKIADAHGVTDWLEGFAPDLTADDWACVIEEVHSMPRDGAVGAFSFGRSCGVLDGVTAALGLSTVKVRPQRWKEDLDLIGSEKTDSRVMAASLWPSHAELFSRVKDDGRAEACLIAAWGALYGPVL